MVASATAPGARNFQTVSISVRERLTRWKTSVKTASEVNAGRGNWRKVARHAACQRSFLSKMARIAPVSIRRLAAITTAEDFLDLLANRLRPAWVASPQDPQERSHGGVQPFLLFVVGDVHS